ncbi:hypothetical protein WMF45_46020 [Sorangium sp. So ce448]|uniref:hypothetical protein n=1 Tax=Sorangium sp. So ce448 TaxID=3133314 RepID=UPI003F5E1116
MPPPYPEPFAALASADSVALGPTGVAAYRSPAFEAYEAAVPIAAQHEALLLDMVQHATPAGRLYAALLLQRMQSVHARETWERLARQDEPVSYAPGGCSIFGTTLASFARGILRDGSPGLFPATPAAGEEPAARSTAPSSSRAAGLRAWFEQHGWKWIGLFWVILALMLWLGSSR